MRITKGTSGSKKPDKTRNLGNESLRRATVDMRGVFDPKGKEIKAQARPDEGKVVPWAGKFKMKQA